MRPRCCLRYFTFFGINIRISSQSSAVSPPLWLPARRGSERAARDRALRFPLLLRENLALVDPHLHPDHAVGGAGFGEAILDVGAQRVQRRIHRLAHGAAEADTLFQLQRDRFRDQLGVELGLVHFLNVDEHLAGGALLQLLLQLVDFRALAADNDARPRRLDDDADLVARALDLDRADARRLQLVLQLGLQLHVFEQQLVVVPLDKPARLPRLGVAEPESVGMDFLTHRSSLEPAVRFRPSVAGFCRLIAIALAGNRRLATGDYFFATAFFLLAPAFRATAFFFAGALGAAAFCSSSPTTVASAWPFLRFSASTISRCAMRRT